MKLETKPESTLAFDNSASSDRKLGKAAMLEQVGSQKQSDPKELATRFGEDNLKSSNREAKRDYYGKVIDKTKKEHHIVFRDILSGQKIADVNEVESYKKYNALEEPSNPQCECSIV